MINVCPVGRNCTYEERLQFFEYDQKHGVRTEMARKMQQRFAKLKFKFSIGGQISIDCFPLGWDKTICLKFVENDFTEILFFGDNTMEGGNDYEIFCDERVVGHTVKNPEDTQRQVEAML